MIFLWLFVTLLLMLCYPRHALIVSYQHAINVSTYATKMFMIN